MSELTLKPIIELDEFLTFDKELDSNYISVRLGQVEECRKLKGYDDSKTIIKDNLVKFGCCYFLDDKPFDEGVVCQACMYKAAYDYKNKMGLIYGK